MGRYRYFTSTIIIFNSKILQIIYLFICILINTCLLYFSDVNIQTIKKIHDTIITCYQLQNHNHTFYGDNL